MNKKYILAIDTTTDDTGIGLVGESRPKIITWVSRRNQSQELLPKIDKLLKKSKIKLNQLKAVAINLGPGSFTGLRIGISVANALGYGLKVPVVGQKNLIGDVSQRIETLLQTKIKTAGFKQVLPHYGRPPRITRSKPKKLTGRNN